MIKEIKQLWGLMVTDTKKSAQKKAMDKFGLSSEVYFRQEWIYGENIPDENQEGLLEIFKEEMKLQHSKTEKILGT